MSNKRTPGGSPTLNKPIKGQGAGASPGPNTNSCKNFLERERQLLQLMNEHVQDRAGKQDYDQIQEELQAKTQKSEELQSQLETLKKDYDEKLSNAKKEVAKQEGVVQTLLDSHERRVREFDRKSQRDNEELARLSRTEDEIQALKRELNTINNERDRFDGRCSQLNKELGEAKEKLRDLKREYQKQKLELEGQAEKLNKSRETSDQLNEDLGALPFDRVSRCKDFEKLASKFHNLVWNTIREKNLHFRDDHTNFPFIDVPGPLLHGIPQVPSNSLPARYMRCALVEAVISHTLSTQVFNKSSLAVVRLKSTSNSESVDLDPIVKGIDALSERGYSLQAAIIQWQLVKVCQHINASRSIASKATRKVCDIIDPWLAEDSGGHSATRASRENFTRQLGGLFLEAAELWQDLQRTRVSPVAVVGNTGGEWVYKEDAWPEYDETEIPPPTPTAGGAATDQNDDGTSRRWSFVMTRGHPMTIPITPLFPQIVAETNLADEDEEYDNIIFHGRALFPMQSVLLAAREEFAVQQERQMRTASPPMTRRLSGHSRQGHSKVGIPAASMLWDDQGQGPSQQAETNRSTGAASASKGNPGRRPSTSSRDGTQPLQQKSTVSDSDRASSTVSSSRRSRRDEKGPPHPTMSESSNRSRRSGTVGSGDRGNR